MLLTITTTHTPATDLGYLLHKNPARVQSFNLSFGQAHVFYPEASDLRCTAALLLDVDPVALVRGPRGEGRTLAQYVNDRPYIASSFLSVAIAQVFGSALKGRCVDRPDLVDRPIPLEATVSVLPCRDGEPFIRRLFEPLGYSVAAERVPLDTVFPDWGDSQYFEVRLAGTVRLSELLGHLYVLAAALDPQKDHYIGDDEVNKLVRRGEGWLSSHPDRDIIVRRYLNYRGPQVRDALAQLTQDEPIDMEESSAQGDQLEDETFERRGRLHDMRLGAVLDVMKQAGARRVLDLGCGGGKLLALLLKDGQFAEILGMDVSYRALERAQFSLKLDRLPPMKRSRINLIQGSLIYRDKRLEGYDAAAVVEVIEHLDPGRLAAFERVLFEFARPGTVVITTPNREFNSLFETLPEGSLRHRDHRFEWTRAEFEEWAQAACVRFGYAVELLPVGPEHPDLGAPSQMAVFTKR